MPYRLCQYRLHNNVTLLSIRECLVYLFSFIFHLDNFSHLHSLSTGSQQHNHHMYVVLNQWMPWLIAVTAESFSKNWLWICQWINEQIIQTDNFSVVRIFIFLAYLLVLLGDIMITMTAIGCVIKPCEMMFILSEKITTNW